MAEEAEQNRSNVAQVLRAYVERIERTQTEIDVLNSDKRDIYAEAKGNGFDVKALKRIVQMRKQDADERSEQDAIVESYMAALGML